MSIESVTLGLEKLATHSGLLQIRDFLADRGVTGVRNSPASCVIARYLRDEEFAGPDSVIEVTPCRDHKDGGVVLVDCRAVPLPRVLNQFANLFDHGGLPDLVDREVPTIRVMVHASVLPDREVRHTS